MSGIYGPGRGTPVGSVKDARPSLIHTYLPTRLVAYAPGASIDDCRLAAERAVNIAKAHSPKLSGRSSDRLFPVHWEEYFGVGWRDDHVWFQNEGIRPFTMTKLAGKVIPMWIDDPTGKERRANPKAKTRTTASGKVQVLIFRRAAKRGERKTVTRKVGGVVREVSVPRSYPGAPGRISRREAGRPWTQPGKVGGQIAESNIGVRWRHPGLTRRGFLHHGLETSAREHGIEIEEIIPVKGDG